MGKTRQREPNKGELVATEIRLVVLHPPPPYLGGDPMRTVLEALGEQSETIVVENVNAATDIDIEIPTRLRQER